VQILVGLGNPGPEYARTRHNLGFRTMDRLAARHGLAFGPVADGCAAAAGRIADVEAVLLKPMLYMNRSGEALTRWAAGRGLVVTAAGEDPAASAPLVVCDDIALPLGAARLRTHGGDGGHRGLVSLIAALRSEAFPRLRLGVAGGAQPPPADAWSDYVLAEFPPEEWPASEELVDHACATLAHALGHGLADAASRFNRRSPAAGEAADSDPDV
jgi:PTH1 family peptidyl-tRNA hydrolase